MHESLASKLHAGGRRATDWQSCAAEAGVVGAVRQEASSRVNGGQESGAEIPRAIGESCEMTSKSHGMSRERERERGSEE